MYCAALTAMFRQCDSRRCSYARRSALATNDVQTKFGALARTRIEGVRRCQGKLYPQHQKDRPGERTATSRTTIKELKSAAPRRSRRTGLRSGERNNAT